MFPYEGRAPGPIGLTLHLQNLIANLWIFDANPCHRQVSLRFHSYASVVPSTTPLLTSKPSCFLLTINSFGNFWASTQPTCLGHVAANMLPNWAAQRWKKWIGSVLTSTGKNSNHVSISWVYSKPNNDLCTGKTLSCCSSAWWLSRLYLFKLQYLRISIARFWPRWFCDSALEAERPNLLVWPLLVGVFNKDIYLYGSIRTMEHSRANLFSTNLCFGKLAWEGLLRGSLIIFDSACTLGTFGPGKSSKQTIANLCFGSFLLCEPLLMEINRWNLCSASLYFGTIPSQTSTQATSTLATSTLETFTLRTFYFCKPILWQLYSGDPYVRTYPLLCNSTLGISTLVWESTFGTFSLGTFHFDFFPVAGFFAIVLRGELHPEPPPWEPLNWKPCLWGTFTSARDHFWESCD